MCLAASSATGLPSLVTDSLPWPGQLAVAVEHRDLVLLHQVLHAARELPGDAAAALDHLGEVEADVVGGEAIGIQRVQQVVDLARAQQRLGRDAAPVEADAAEVLALHQRGLHAELGGADRGDIAAGAAADHDEVEVCSAMASGSLPAARAASAVAGRGAAGSSPRAASGRRWRGRRRWTARSSRARTIPSAPQPSRQRAAGELGEDRLADALAARRGFDEDILDVEPRPAGEGGEACSTRARSPPARRPIRRSAPGPAGLAEQQARAASCPVAVAPRAAASRTRRAPGSAQTTAGQARVASRSESRPPSRSVGLAAVARTAHSIRLSGSSMMPLQRLHELGRQRAVDDAVVDRQRAGHHRGDGQRAVLHHRPLLAGRDRQDAGLRRVDDRGEVAARRTSPCWRC